MKHLVPLLLLGACAGGSDGNQLAPGPDGLRAELTVPVLRDHTRALTEIGPRQVATVGEVEAERVVVERLEAMGYDVELHAFTWDAWRPGTATLEVSGETWQVEAHSPSPRATLVAPLRRENEDVAGAIALYQASTGSRAEHFLRAVSNGAVAFVRITDFLDFDGSGLVEVGHTLEGSNMPGAAVDAFTGQALEQRAGQTATLVIEPDIAVGHTSQNVVARIGPANADRRVFLLAHYDSWHPSESAFDNALGVGALLAIADRLATGPAPAAEVVLIATSGEEQGLQGAFAWARDHASEIRADDVAVTFDVLWSGEGDYSCMATTDEDRALVMEASEAEGLAVEDGGDPGVASDHFPFVIEGADAIWCGRWPDRHYHTVADTLDQLDLKQANSAVRAQWAAVAELAGVEP